ncbi:MBL fold metallo-hydrolase [bacterium]|nr:MBL fold metallo-hydrolase [bacterium]MBU1074026.1 MBL fold metallo-hydrolase [bacterium]MBU1676585.1 MBL fold metallo-hydrolase [bacterium]
MISVLILGAGGAIPTPVRGPAAYWLSVDDRTVLLDPGPGALVRLVASPHGPDGLDEIDTVLFTHLHLDHCSDLAALLFAMRSEVLCNTRPLQLIGPRGLAGYLDRLGELYGDWVVPRCRTVEVLEIGSGDAVTPTTRAGGWVAGGDTAGPAVSAFAVEHFEDRFSSENLGFRVRDGQGNSLVFSGDTGPCGRLAEAAAGADLLVVECSMPDEYGVDGHMTPARLAELCVRAAPHRVVLTHIYPAAAELDLPRLVGDGFAGDVVAAVDGDIFSLGGETT